LTGLPLSFSVAVAPNQLNKETQPHMYVYLLI
jgi:hypothetical protein